MFNIGDNMVSRSPVPVEEWRRIFADIVKQCRKELAEQGKFGRGFHVSREALKACIKRKIAEKKKEIITGKL